MTEEIVNELRNRVTVLVGMINEDNWEYSCPSFEVIPGIYDGQPVKDNEDGYTITLNISEEGSKEFPVTTARKWRTDVLIYGRHVSAHDGLEDLLDGVLEHLEELHRKKAQTSSNGLS